MQMALVIVRLQDLGLILLLLSLASIGLISVSLFGLVFPTLNSPHHYCLSNIAILSSHETSGFPERRSSRWSSQAVQGFPSSSIIACNAAIVKSSCWRIWIIHFPRSVRRVSWFMVGLTGGKGMSSGRTRFSEGGILQLVELEILKR